MIRKSVIVFLLVALTSFGAHAAGFEPGAAVRAVEPSGQEIAGTIVKFENSPEISVLDKSGHYFKIDMKEVRRISPVAGQTVMTGGGSSLRVVKFDMVNGQSVSAGLSSNAVVKLDMGVRGQRNLWITDTTKYKLVEVVEPGAAGSGDGQMKVILRDGRVVPVPVRKTDVRSIVFD